MFTSPNKKKCSQHFHWHHEQIISGLFPYYNVRILYFLQCFPPFPFRQCATASPSSSLTPSLGWVTATARWTPSSTLCSWGTSSELWRSSCPAVPHGHREDPRLHSPSPCETQESPTWPAARPRLWPLTPRTPLPPPQMPSTCWTLSMLGLSCLCCFPIRWTLWTE